MRTFGADGQRSKNEKIKLPSAHEIQDAGNGPRLAERGKCRAGSTQACEVPAQSERNTGEGTVRAWM